ncbi:MAG: FtsQ-type POTRA domain-containing protein [Gammaproteobacteria bacterium]|nr:FtsQ-type POTRA domain-containing protein [Gammaproteobacteria bacterium]
MSQKHHNNESETQWLAIFSRLFLMVVISSLLISTVLLFNWLNEPENFPFKKVELVNRLENQESRELQKIAAKALNGGFFSLDVDAFRADLLSQLPWVKSVSVRKVWPNKLLVSITEHKPVVRWKTESAVSKTAKGYQLLSQEGLIIEPELTEQQKLKFNRMALLSGPETSAENVLRRCVEFSKSLEAIGLGVKHCGMNKRRAWQLSLIQGIKASSHNEADIKIEIKLGKENILQQLKRFIRVFSGKLKHYLNAVEYADLRYSNGFSIKWKTGLEKAYD